MDKKQQIIFITSEARSGSTFLSYMLGTNPKSAHLGEFFRPYRRGAQTSCRLCKAKGFDKCKILGDLSAIPQYEAHSYALNCFEKHGVNTLIDCSKDMNWIEEIIQNHEPIESNITFKIIHLVREPRGWISSERRRAKTMTIHKGIERWKNHFYSTSDRINTIGANFMRITYEELLLCKETALQKLSNFIGFPQHADQYQYWSREHHGFGGNGAAYNNLARFSDGTCNTGDDYFYKKNHEKDFYDLRWEKENDRHYLNNLFQDKSVQDILLKCGISCKDIDEALSKYKNLSA